MAHRLWKTFVSLLPGKKHPAPKVHFDTVNTNAPLWVNPPVMPVMPAPLGDLAKQDPRQPPSSYWTDPSILKLRRWSSRQAPLRGDPGGERIWTQAEKDPADKYLLRNAQEMYKEVERVDPLADPAWPAWLVELENRPTPNI
jgi:hypothetical protein